MPYDPREIYRKLKLQATTGTEAATTSPVGFGAELASAGSAPIQGSIAPAAGSPAAGAGTSFSGDATAFYNTLMGRLGESEFFGAGNRPAQSLFEQNQSRLVSEIIPALMSSYSENIPAFASNNPWYAGYLLSSALTGRPYYNPDESTSFGNLKYIPGYAPTGSAPSTMQRNAHPGYSYYWMG